MLVAVILLLLIIINNINNNAGKIEHFYWRHRLKQIKESKLVIQYYLVIESS